MEKSDKKINFRRMLAQVFLLVISAGASFFAVFYLDLSPEPATDLVAGDVASQDILAPRAITYESLVKTEEKREC